METYLKRFTTGTVTGSGDNVGGIASYLYTTTSTSAMIYDCYSTGAITPSGTPKTPAELKQAATYNASGMGWKVGDATSPWYMGADYPLLRFDLPALQISHTTLELKGDVSSAKITVASGKATRWWSDNAAVATVDQTGMVTRVGNGETFVWVEDAYGNKVSCKVVCSVIPPVLSAAVSIFQGQIISLSAFHNVSETKMTWSSSAPAIAAVNTTEAKLIWLSGNPSVAEVEDGIITAVSSGITMITAVGSNGRVSARLDVYVDAELTQIAVTPEDQPIMVGKQIQLEAKTVPEGLNAPEVIWSVSDTSIAVVDSEGVVTGLAAGFVTVWATSVDNSEVYGETTVTVRLPLVETLSAWQSIPLYGPYKPSAAYDEDFKNFGLLTGVGVSIQDGKSSSALQSIGWNFAEANTRAWQVEFKTTGFENIRVSSIQTANNKSPNNFVIEYSLDGRDWALLPTGGDAENPTYEYFIRTASDPGATARAVNVLLPPDCNNQSRVLVRWRSINDQGPNEAVAASAPSIIRDIVITGEH